MPKKKPTKARTLEAKTTEAVNEVASIELPPGPPLRHIQTEPIPQTPQTTPPDYSDDNEYNVPVDQWNKWSKSQRSRFNEVYSAMKLSPSLFTHPDAVTIPAEQWTTIAWNAAWVAAGA